VIKGVKWSAPKWIHLGHYAGAGEQPVKVEAHPQKVPGPNGCADNHDMCEEWAAEGECEKNGQFMVGSALAPGACLQACGRCDLLDNAGGKSRYAVGS
jgi:prolyl 4-hydroxylase